MPLEMKKMTTKLLKGETSKVWKGWIFWLSKTLFLPKKRKPWDWIIKIQEMKLQNNILEMEWKNPLPSPRLELMNIFTKTTIWQQYIKHPEKKRKAKIYRQTLLLTSIIINWRNKVLSKYRKPQKPLERKKQPRVEKLNWGRSQACHQVTDKIPYWIKWLYGQMLLKVWTIGRDLSQSRVWETPQSLFNNALLQNWNNNLDNHKWTITSAVVCLLCEKAWAFILCIYIGRHKVDQTKCCNFAMSDSFKLLFMFQLMIYCSKKIYKC